MDQAHFKVGLDDYCLHSRIFILFVACALLILLRPLLLDPDYYWHLETGRLIFEQRALPSKDVFAYTYAGQHWVMHEWLFQLILFAVHAQFGAFGVKLLCAAVTTAILGIVYSTAQQLSGRHAVAAAITVALIVQLSLFILPRPQIMSFLLVAFLLRALLLAKYLDNRRLLNWLPPAMVLWVNLHGGFAVGLAVILAFAAFEWLLALMDGSTGSRRSYLRHLSFIALLSLWASFANPEGPRHLLYPFETVGLAATDVIVEWQQPDFGQLVGMFYLLATGAFVLLLVYRRGKPDLTEIGLPGIMIVAGLISVRHVPFAALTMAVLASRMRLAAVPWQNHLLQPIRRWRERLRSAVPGSPQIGAAEVPLNLLGAAALIAGGVLYYPTAAATEATELADWQPVKAVEFIRANDITGRMFNSLHFGGYLIHRLHGRLPVFIDGRTDMYGDKFFAEYLDLNFGRDGWDSLMQKYHIDLVITTPDAQIGKMVRLQGSFALVYRDRASVILLRRNAANAKIIDKFGL